ncbi:sacsin N-terminal ATP-binding-like domain-containing protein [Paraliomyxa miuraensis]|uniref:sacsin N-terminal ATP-binding-like domain-containing protein n=1 Tax=Paraliomyxa miuraensis TaxID=376150 RepID=UPI00225AAEAA|nr:hypothetical protein [Paraliomyxa miuraensis]MCX4245436.1 hypothetical protein [Paraliomyxa miuraensis]
MSDSTPQFASLPLDEQLRWLGQALERGEDPRVLLRTCAAVRDHAPLSWLARALLERGFLAQPSEQGWVAQMLLEQPDTAVDRVLRALVGEGRFSAVQGKHLQAMLLAVLERVTLAQVSVMCLVDRALKHNFVEARDAHVQALTERCAEALREGRGHEVTVDELAQVSAPGIAALRRQAAAHGPPTAAALEATLEDLALRTLEVLGRAPKAVSQANAEELLSKRVYTDPGHFLVELLQNAEDSGARCFRLRFEPRRIVLWHDGQPFDTRDVVGVTSIGQTTKRKQQIGFFGVGFKSVYEVTDRPRIYSDVYRFEIADVSIPKPLSARPADVPPDGTVLVLPLRNPADPQRSPAVLFGKARDLDAIVLFTLRRIDVIELELVDEAGAVTRHAVHELPPDARGISRIRQEPEGWVRGYAVHDAEHVYSGGTRAPGRADRTRVMVGLRIDDEGVPRTLEEDTPTIYSYLPTEERSGLRFFVQGHFDVPVDRERITQDSRWNEWILSKVPEGLAALATRLTEGLEEAMQLRVAAGLLEVLPLPDELGSPIFRRLETGLRQAFAGLAIVPCDDGTLQPPGAALRADDELAALFEGELARVADGPRHLVHRELPRRAVDVAMVLGTRSLSVTDVVAGLEQVLGSHPDGTHHEDPTAPPFVRQPTPARLAALYEVLEGALMRRTGAGPRRLVDLGLLQRARSLPLVLSEQQTLHRPGSGIVRAEPALREIYAGLRAFVHPEHDAAVDPEDPARATATAFLERLGVGCLTVRELVLELEARLGGHEGPLLDLGATDFPGTPGRLRAALGLLADAPAPMQRRAARLPVFLAQDGRYHRAAAKPGDRKGVLRFEPSRVAEALLDYYGHSRPICVLEEDEPALALLRSARTPTLSLAALVADLKVRAASLTAEQLQQLHGLLEHVRDELPERMQRELAELPIWPDLAGTPRPLQGEGAVRIPSSPAVAALLAGVPWLHPSVLARRHARSMGGEEVGLDALVDALAPEAEAPLRIEPTEASVSAVLQVLRAERDAIAPRLRARLAEVPLFLDDEGRPARLDALVLAEDPALRALYVGWPGRRFVDPQSITRAAVAELELDARLARADAATLVEDLEALSARLEGQAYLVEALALVGGADALGRLLHYCAQRAPTLSRTLVQRLAGTAVFPDRDDRLGRLGDAHGGARGAEVFACDDAVRPIFAAAGVRVLADWAQPLVESIIEATGRERLSVISLVDHLARAPEIPSGGQRPAVQTPEVLARIHAVLVEQASVLAHRFPPLPREGAAPSSPALGRLAIWPTVANGVIRAEHAILSPSLGELLPAGTTARARLDAVTLEPGASASLQRLAPLLLPASAPAFAATLVEAEARPGEPLARQPSWLREPAAAARVAAFIGPQHAPRPWVDATEHLRVHPLAVAGADTVALVMGTPLAERLLHPAMAEALLDLTSLSAIEPAAVLDALAAGVVEPTPLSRHPVLHDDERRRRFYAWLQDREALVFVDADARTRLRMMPLFPTDRGTLRPADQLVIDPELPQLPVDWTPHPELPESTLGLLVRHLGVGRPPVDDLVVDHLAPAYRRAAAVGDGPGAARLLEYLARALAPLAPHRAHALLSGEGAVMVEGSHGRFVPASTLLMPPGELDAATAAVFGTTHPRPHPRLGPSTESLLIALGVARTPPRTWVADVMRGGVASVAAATGLAVLVAHLYRAHPAQTVAELPLREVAWVLDGNDVARRPSELFGWTTDVQALVGEAPELYPAPAIARALGDDLCAALGFRTAADVRLPEVTAHIERSSQARIPVPFRVYAWLERGLSEGWIDGAELRRRLTDTAWVCSDDGEYHPHERVLGLRALEHFGARRGYWERGWRECPTLCRSFGITDRLTPAVLMAFLEELAVEAEAHGDRALLGSEPGLPRMLQRAYAALGQRPDAPPARVVLCRQHGGDDDGSLRLRPPEDPLVLRSDAPTLEAMFAEVGTFFVATLGPLEERSSIDAYFERCGIRRLRESYEVRAAETGLDQTAAHGEGLGELRACLRGLLAVLPRVRLQRTHLADDAWVYEPRLSTLARSGPIRARDGLQVDYVLPGVGRARRRAVAVFDPGTSTLLVDTRVLTDPDAVVTGLAQGLLPCLYDGPGEEQLVDIVEILLRLRTRARMDDYLDQRHFPIAAEPERGYEGRLAARVGELFDYGLERRLCARFPELRDRSLDRWRDPGMFASLPEEEEHAVRTLVARMLAAVDVSEPSQALTEALALLLSATSLSDVPAGLLAPLAVVEPAPSEGGPRSPAPLPGEQDVPSLEELEARLAELTARSQHEPDAEASSSHRFVIPTPSERPRAADRPIDPLPGPRPTVESWLDLADDDDTEREPTSAEGDDERSGFWQRLARRLGLSDDAPIDESRPAWATPGANVLSPARFIGPQLWVRGRALREMAGRRVPMGMLHQPPVLPSPHRYVVHTLGVAFEPSTQQWHPQPLPPMPALFEGESLGATVAFAGTLMPGRSVLPVPLFGDVTRLEVVGASPSVVRPLGRLYAGSAVVDVDASGPVKIRYEVGLRRPPVLTEDRAPSLPMPGPTVPRERLPAPVREWLARNASSERGAWEQARRVEAFVQRHYAYDLEFRERPAVERATRELRAGAGNHHLALLHASADQHALGYGVCYELNILVVELLRHLGVPAMVATGWMLDEGFADRPDHLFALAVVPSASGPCLLPLDASTGPRGPVRPLQGAAPPTVELQPVARPPVPTSGGGWGTPVLPGPEREVAVDEHVHALHRTLRSELDREREALRRIVRIADAAYGRGPSHLPAHEELTELRRRAMRALGDPTRLEPMLAVIRGEYELTDEVPEGIQALIRDGLALVESLPGYRVKPADGRDG